MLTSSAPFQFGNFSTLDIQFSQQNHASVFFAHLQNVLKDLEDSQKLSDDVQFNKADRVLYDIYLQHKKLEANYATVQKGINQLMTQFSKMLEECKSDREKLEKSMEERQNLMTKLKDVNDKLYDSMVENQVLKQTVNQIKQLNSLMNEKNCVLQEQAQNFKVSVLGMQDYKRISAQYDRLLESNQQMRKDLIEITTQTQILQLISTPFKICCLAITQNPDLKQNIWKLAQTQSQQTNKQKYLQSLKPQFYAFQYTKFGDDVFEKTI